MVFEHTAADECELAWAGEGQLDWAKRMPERLPNASRGSRSARYNPGFWSLVVTQFQGAFNDNALKFLVIYLVVGMSLPVRERDWLVLVVGALFAVPFILFSMTCGFLADRFSKRSVTIGTKWMELGVMLFALMALARGNLALEAAGVFLLSSQAAIFGPSKYGLLPELLPEKDLSWGNGVVELGTFLAAISATVASGFFAFYFRGHQERSGIALLGCTLFGLAASFGISRVPAANPARKGGVIAAANLISFVGVFAAAGVYFALAQGLRLRADKIFFAGACMTLAATFYAVVFLPDSVLRLALWLLTHSIYRIRVEGRDNIPERGGALFVANELTLLEAIFLSAATDRPIRCVTDSRLFAHTAAPIRRALRITQVPEKATANGFLETVAMAFASGEVVCLAGQAASALVEDSAERGRLEEYLRETRSPIVVVSINGAESGPLQSEDGRLRLAASHLRGRVTLRIREPLAPSENLAFAEALRFLKAAPALGFSVSPD